LSDHPGTGPARRGAPARAWGLALGLQSLALVGCGFFAASASRAERPTPGLLAAWACCFILVLLGLVTARALARPEGLPRWALALVLAASAGAQAPLVAAPPALSDDLWRYVHDGRVVAAGWNPYLRPPSDEALDVVAGPERARVNHPDVRTAYPPLAEALFAAVVMLGGGAGALKAVLAACGLGLVGLTAALLGPARRWRVVAVAWHPLLLLEVAGSGHVDVAAVLALLASAWALQRGRRVVAAALLVTGAWVKLLPAAVAIPWARRLGVATAPALVLAAAAVLPPLLVSLPEGEQPGLAAYAEHWDFNGIVYPWLRSAVETAGLMEALQALTERAAPALSPWMGPQYTTRALLGAGWLVLLALGLARCGPEAGGEGVERAAFLACAGFVLLTPTLHPWYALWVLPFAVLRGSTAWTWLCGAVGLSYASAIAAGGGAWQELDWPRWLQHGPFAVLLVRELARARRPR
jgi:hypothetical protein